MQTQYLIIRQKSTNKLSKEVHSRLSEGWILQGGIAIGNGQNPEYFQAMKLHTE